MPPRGGCGFPTIVSLYSANTALRVTPGILPESVGVVKRKCGLDPPTASGRRRPGPETDPAEGERRPRCRDSMSLRRDGEDRRWRLLTRVRQGHENQQECEHCFGPEIVVVYPVPETTIGYGDKGGVRPGRAALDGDGRHGRVRRHRRRRKGSTVLHVLFRNRDIGRHGAEDLHS